VKTAVYQMIIKSLKAFADPDEALPMLTTLIGYHKHFWCRHESIPRKI